MRLRGVVTSAVAGMLALTACSSSDAGAAGGVDAQALSAAVTTDAVLGHLVELEQIAAAHDGNRAAGTSGYDASVDYVARILRDKGFDVQTPEFAFDRFDVHSQSLRVGELAPEIVALTYSPSSGPDGVRGRVVPVPADDTPGCEPTDYDGLDVAGAIALVDRGSCTFADKQAVAADRGAAALLVANNSPEPLTGGTLGDAGAGRIPVGGVGQADGAALAASPGEATLVLDTITDTLRTRNVVAQTRTGSTDDVVMAGAHLDSVPEGPGVNDNGTGVGAVLETALALGPTPPAANAVRFAFWGGEELGLLGSDAYVAGLDDAQRDDIALYLNFDMLGSENAGYLSYDGDDSDRAGSGPGPEGSAGIERTFVDYLAAQGISADGTDFDGRSDYGPFIEAGIPSGGVFSGADDVKSAEQARKWGGDADQPFDRNYHSPDDTLANVDAEALGVGASAVAYAVGTYANSVEGENGVPVGDARAHARTTE
ncbi:M28 family peptidase [Rhodococcus sp. HNM0569]|uniref:M28 family peptidase n=1 Tax=Rhodococcus sp. HNM0569 TaxID=2716340 RepID=UPI001469FB96|nr:M28 family peptidase [Rhodococcus sp. HNM0569]NLU83156.1 M28 family peptidase [Rhodococcus sp. HNM0569]